MRKSPLAVAVAAFGLIVAAIPTHAADVAAGQKLFQGTCAGCHQLKSYAGKSSGELETEIKGIVAGTTTHPKKLTLSDGDVSNVSAYISANEPK